MCYLCGCLLFWKGFWAVVFTVTVRTVSDHDYCMRWETKAQEAQNTVSQHIKMRWFSICYLHLCVIFLHLLKPLNLQSHTQKSISPILYLHVTHFKPLCLNMCACVCMCMCVLPFWEMGLWPIADLLGPCMLASYFKQESHPLSSLISLLPAL